MMWPLRSTTITVASALLRTTPPLYSALVLRSLWDLHSRTAPFTSEYRFPRSIHEPGLCSRHLYAGCRLASNQVSARLFPVCCRDTGFDIGYRVFDASSVVHSRSSPQSLPDRVQPCLFLQRSPQWLLIYAAWSGLVPPPEKRHRGTCPHLTNSMLTSNLFGTGFVAHRQLS